jgi:hypothetical protein
MKNEEYELTYENLIKVPKDKKAVDIWKGSTKEFYIKFKEKSKKIIKLPVFAQFNHKEKTFTLWVDTFPVLKLKDAIKMNGLEQVNNNFFLTNDE